MDVKDFAACKVMTQSPSWGLTDLLMWKLIPGRLGGGIEYIRRFKDSWVVHNKSLIKTAAFRNKLPVELLVGVCWIEVGGDPNFIDKVAFEVRSFDWSGPAFTDNHLTVTRQPEKTSFGFVSMQLRTAAEKMGLDVAKMETSQLRKLADCLENDSYNITLAAMHLRQIADYDRLPAKLSMADIRIIGARYTRGLKPTLESIKKTPVMAILLCETGNILTSWSGGNVNKLSRILLLICYVVGLTLLYAVTVDKYAWMGEMDPSLSSTSIISKNPSGNSNVISMLVLFFLILIQAISFRFEHQKKWKVISLVLAFIAVFLYAVR